MTINEQIKILDDKIRSNKAQYDLDRQNAKVSALSSGELDKYEYLTGEDLGYKPDVIQKAKFEYRPLGQIFNKGLKADGKQERLLKRQKNIEDKTDKKLEENKNSQLGGKFIGYTVKIEFSQEAKNILEKLNNQERLINYKKLRGGINKDYEFTNFSSLRELFRTIYYGEILIPGAEGEQDNFDDIIRILIVYNPRKDSKYYKLKQDLLINAPTFYDGRELIIETFKNKIFPLSSPDYYPEYVSEEGISPKSSFSSDSEEDELLESKGSTNSFDKLLTNVDEILDLNLVKKYFGSNSLKQIVRQLRYLRRHKNKMSAKDAKIVLIEAGLSELKNDIKNMSEDEVKNKGLDLLKNIVEKILDANKRLDMPELETEESAAQRQQKGQGLKILTPKQMISRLPILLAQLKAGNNSQKLRNKIKQIVYSLYRSKNLCKTAYNNLVNTI